MNIENYGILQEMLNELRQQNDDVSKSRVERLEKVLREEESSSINMLQIQEDERLRISRDLHDTSLQNLACIVHKIELSSMYIDKDPLQAKLELSVVNKNLRGIIEEIRNTIFNLRPMAFDDLGLKASIDGLLTVINKSKDYDVILDIDDVSCENNMILLMIYRIIQESLINIKKHSEASKICISGKYSDDYYRLSIKDNGKGFSKEDIDEKKNNHFGLSLMKERIKILGGTVNIISQCGEGTEVTIMIPVDNDLVIRKGAGRSKNEY